MYLQEIETKVLGSIPILKSMGVRLKNVDEYSCEISVPLNQNHNHKNTVFGGSLYSACTAACYSLIYTLQVRDKVLEYDLVIAKGEMIYLKPTPSDFIVISEVDPAEWRKFVQNLNAQKNSGRSRKKSGRLIVTSTVRLNRETDILCQFTGQFAFVPSSVEKTTIEAGISFTDSKG